MPVFNMYKSLKKRIWLFIKTRLKTGKINNSKVFLFFAVRYT